MGGGGLVFRISAGSRSGAAITVTFFCVCAWLCVVCVRVCVSALDYSVRSTCALFSLFYALSREPSHCSRAIRREYSLRMILN